MVVPIASVLKKTEQNDECDRTGRSSSSRDEAGHRSSTVTSADQRLEGGMSFEEALMRLVGEVVLLVVEEAQRLAGGYTGSRWRSAIASDKSKQEKEAICTEKVESRTARLFHSQRREDKNCVRCAVWVG